MKKVVKGAALFATAGVTALGFSGVVGAAESQMVQGTMQEMNSSGASGTSQIKLNGDGTATFTVNMTGVAPSMPHAQHVHFGDTTESDSGPVVPPAEAADDNTADPTTTGNAGVATADGKPVPAGSQIDFDEYINTLEGKPFYGNVQISLTTTGDSSPTSGLAVNRFPAGDASGAYSYERTINLTNEQIENVKAGDVEIVVHGGDFWGPGAPDTPDGNILSYTYDADSDGDGDPGTSPAEDLYPKSPLAAALGAGPLPLEATMPVATAEFGAVPEGSVDTGLGAGTTQASNLLIAGGAAAAVTAAGASVLYARRRGEVK